MPRLRLSRMAVAFAVALIGAGLARADQLVPDDLVVTGGICVGFDCVVNESFADDVLHLKENNTRIRFDDTDATAHDWQLEANDSPSGGLNQFSIRNDATATRPFLVQAGAPSISLLVTAEGNVGVGTFFPDATLTVTGDANVGGTVTAGALAIAGDVAVDSVTTSGPIDAGSLTIANAADVGGNLTVSGTVDGRDLAADAIARTGLGDAAVLGTKAGIVPAAAFSTRKPTATVTFQKPYDGPYVVTLTVMTSGGKKAKVPSVLQQTDAGFVVALGTSRVGAVTEVHWYTQPIP